MAAESNELDEIRTLARDFALAELRPHVEQWDHERATDDGVAAQLAELGFFGMAIPEQFGGMDLGVPAAIAIIEELAYGEASVAVTVALHARAALLLLKHGTDAQRSAWLERLASGDARSCIAIAEEGEMRTTASRADDGWQIRGAKRWVSGATDADVAIVLARIDGNDEQSGLFLVDMSAPGVTIGERDDTLGLRAMPIHTVTFDGARVGAGALLGSSADAGPQLMAGATFLRLAVAAIAVGIARAALDHARDYANIREQFGQPLRMFEGIQFKLADMSAKCAAAGALLQSVAQSGDAARADMAKLFAARTAMDVTTQAVQVYGGYGYMRDYPVEKLMRDAKAMEIMGGSNEEIAVAIAQSLYPS